MTTTEPTFDRCWCGRPITANHCAAGHHWTGACTGKGTSC